MSDDRNNNNSNKRWLNEETNKGATELGITEKTTTSSRAMIHLLLPTPNGVVPYLTPTLAERHFSKFGTKGSNQLWLGVAARDTCVVPSFSTGASAPKHGGAKNNNSNINEDKEKDQLKKPTGYSISFTASTKSATSNKDAAVMPSFTHVTVPSFDLLQDELDYQLLLKQPKPKRNGTKSPPPPPPNNKTNDALSKMAAATTASAVAPSVVESTNRHVMVWTPHGRQTLKPDQYQTVAQGLNSSFTLSLYDQCPIHAANTSRRRRQYMKRRNSDWLNHLILQSPSPPSDTSTTTTETTTANNHSKYIVPWIITDEEPNVTANENEEQKDPNSQAATTSKDTLGLLLQQRSNVAGVALIGWPHLTLEEQRDCPPWLSSFVTQFQQSKRALAQQNRDDLLLFVLETRSLSHILHAMELGANVIATSLPMMWAQQHKAFVLDFEQYQPPNNNNNNDAKRPRLEPSEEDQQHVECDENGCWDMAQKVFQLDQRPLVHNCTCFACRGGGGFTASAPIDAASSSSFSSFRSPPTPPTCRAYLHHLTQTQELLGEMLLFAHNLHHMLRFFQHVSQSIPPEEFPAFSQNLLKQLLPTTP